MNRIASPCTGICRLDQATSWCLGCGRTAFEIGRWPEADEEERARIWRKLPARMAELENPQRK